MLVYLLLPLGLTASVLFSLARGTILPSLVTLGLIWTRPAVCSLSAVSLLDIYFSKGVWVNLFITLGLVNFDLATSFLLLLASDS